MTRSNPPSRTTRGAWRLLALAVLGAAACGDSIATIEQTAGRGPAEEPAGAAASSNSNSAAQLDTAAAQVVEGGLGEPHLDPAAYVQGDSIVRDSVVVGHLSQDTTSGSVAPISGLPPGHCLVLIYYYLDTGEIIGYTILHCEPSEELAQRDQAVACKARSVLAGTADGPRVLRDLEGRGALTYRCP